VPAVGGAVTPLPQRLGLPQWLALQEPTPENLR